MLNFLNMLYTALRLKFTPFILDLNIAVKKKKSRIISVNSGPSQAVPVCLEGGGRGVCGRSERSGTAIVVMRVRGRGVRRSGPINQPLSVVHR